MSRPGLRSRVCDGKGVWGPAACSAVGCSWRMALAKVTGASVSVLHVAVYSPPLRQTSHTYSHLPLRGTQHCDCAGDARSVFSPNNTGQQQPMHTLYHCKKPWSLFLPCRTPKRRVEPHTCFALVWFQKGHAPAARARLQATTALPADAAWCTQHQSAPTPCSHTHCPHSLRHSRATAWRSPWRCG
jgi:hypothetical protein